MSFVRDLTPEEAIEYALDPRNDSGQPDSLHVMAQNYDPDCPNSEDHTLDENGFEICECWDGITADDVGTWTEGGEIDVAGFGEWGPFQLVSEQDPGPARGPSPLEAWDIVSRFIEAASLDYGRGHRPDVEAAMTRLYMTAETREAEDEARRLEEEEADPCGHEFSDTLCVYCLQYDVDPRERCPERDEDDCDDEDED